jgi:hypothetical protein
MNWHLELAQHSPAGPLSCLDAAWGELGPRPLIFVLDATLSRAEGSGTRPPRARLLECLCRAWPRLRELTPHHALEHLAEVFCAYNQHELDHCFHASAAMARLSTDESTWEFAECGDTRIYRSSENGGSAVWKDLPPPSDHRVSGAIGSVKPIIRQAAIPLEVGEGLSILTDGAYHLLARHGMITPTCFSVEAWYKFSAIKVQATDDATFLHLTPQSL